MAGALLAGTPHANAPASSCCAPAVTYGPASCCRAIRDFRMWWHRSPAGSGVTPASRAMNTASTAGRSALHRSLSAAAELPAPSDSRRAGGGAGGCGAGARLRHRSAEAKRCGGDRPLFPRSVRPPLRPRRGVLDPPLLGQGRGRRTHSGRGTGQRGRSHRPHCARAGTWSASGRTRRGRRPFGAPRPWVARAHDRAPAGGSAQARPARHLCRAADDPHVFPAQ